MVSRNGSKESRKGSKESRKGSKEVTFQLPLDVLESNLGPWLQQLQTSLLVRMDFQDDMLKQILREGPHRDLQPVSPIAEIYDSETSAVYDGTISAGFNRRGPKPPELAGQMKIQQTPASGAVAPALSSSPKSSTATLDEDDEEIRRSRMRLRSYSAEDLDKKHEAEVADTHFLRRMFSAQSRHHAHVEKMRNAGRLGKIVRHPGFDLFFAVVVITNAIFIGIDVQRMTEADDGVRPVGLMIVGYIYTSLYVAELVLRLIAYGHRLFCSEDWMWVLLDCFIVATSLWDVFVDILSAALPDDNGFDSVSGLSTLKAFRVVRVTRVLKIAQLLRIFRFVMALRTLVQSIFHTLKALVWALLLLLLIVYVFAVIFTQAVSDYRVDIYANGAELPALIDTAGDLYFGALHQSMLSLFMSIAGGVSWEELIRPLWQVSWLWAMAFIFYVSFTYFAVLNVVTAVFCQSAIESAQKDHATVVQNMLDNKETHLRKLRTLFSKLGAEEAGGITFGMFEQKINSGPVREYFEALGLDVWDPWSFFKLLDSDGGGFVEIEEFFLGCLRFSGAAKAMDVGKLIQDQTWLIRSQGRFQRYIEDELVKMRDDTTTLRDFVSSLSRGVACAQL